MVVCWVLITLIKFISELSTQSHTAWSWLQHFMQGNIICKIKISAESLLKIRLYALVVYIYSVLGCLTVSDCVEGRHIIAGNSRPPPAPTARTTDMMASVPATNNQHIIQDNWRTVLSSHYHILTSPHITSWDWIF